MRRSMECGLERKCRRNEKFQHRSIVEPLERLGGGGQRPWILQDGCEEVTVTLDPVQRDGHAEISRPEAGRQLLPTQGRRTGAPGLGRTEYTEAMVFPQPFWR